MKKDRVYDIRLQINIDNNKVNYAECTCPAGHSLTGSCKHLAALCFAVDDFVHTWDTIMLMENGQISCTSVLQQ